MAQTLVIDGLKRRTLPINLRQSGNSDAQMLISARIRKSPWWHLSKAAGCWAYTTYNHMYHPRAYIKPEDGGLFAEYKYLTEHVSMWDVAVQRQIQIKGPFIGKEALASVSLEDGHSGEGPVGRHCGCRGGAGAVLRSNQGASQEHFVKNQSPR